MAVPMILQLQTLPASSLRTQWMPDDLHRYRKELIKTGSYVHPTTKHAFSVTVDILHHWASMFHKWLSNGHKVPIPLGHEHINEPEKNVGYVTNMFVEGNSLFSIMELLDPALALTTDVSIAVGDEIDEKGIKYSNMISHVALTTRPVIGGLTDFQVMSLSLSKGAHTMEFLKKLALKLGITSAEPTEAEVLLALSQKPAVPADPLANLPNLVNAPGGQVVTVTQENRTIKLSGLVTAGLITPAICEAIKAKYVATEALTLELSKGADDHFEFLYNVLAKNAPIPLAEVTGVQSLELANQRVAQPNPLVADANKRRVAAGMTVAS